MQAHAWWVTSGFGHRHHPALGERRFHDGVDLATPTGTPIRAASDGVVRVGAARQLRSPAPDGCPGRRMD